MTNRENSMMKEHEILEKIHGLHLVLAEELKRICEKYNIKYFMIAGTLLGAVRHKGFIPWDDDMDFGMLREDFEHFLAVCSLELNKTLFYLQTGESDKYYTFNFAKLRLNGTEVYEEFSGKSKTHKGIYIDIFPIDAVPDNKIARGIQYKLFWFYRNILWVKCGYGSEKRKKTLEYKIAKFLSSFFTIEWLKEKKEKIISKYKGIITKDVVTSDGTYGLKKETLRREWIDNICDYDFEDKVYPGIEASDEYLSYFYGDYMKLPPENKRNHHGRLYVDFGEY